MIMFAGSGNYVYLPANEVTQPRNCITAFDVNPDKTKIAYLFSTPEDAQQESNNGFTMIYIYDIENE